LIGFITIGQTPRDDLMEPYKKLLADHELMIAGALDEMDANVIPSSDGKYPLVTKLRTGEFIQVEKSFLETRIQGAIEKLESSHVQLIVLLWLEILSRLLPVFRYCSPTKWFHK
jgi:hypothetical protein